MIKDKAATVRAIENIKLIGGEAKDIFKLYDGVASMLKSDSSTRKAINKIEDLGGNAWMILDLNKYIPYLKGSVVKLATDAVIKSLIKELGGTC